MSSSLSATLDAARAGDTAAFGRLVQAHQSAICAITLALTGSVAASEEVAQEVFVAAWEGLPRLRNPESFGTWLRQIARNRSRKALRARQRDRLVPDEDTVAAAVGGPTAEDVLLEAEEREALAAALDALDVDAREVVFLYYREDRSTAQVAQLLELSEPAVRKRLSRARAALREDVRRRLGPALERTAPAAAFTVAVLAALAPRRAHASSRGLQAAALALGLGAVGLAGVLGFRAASDPAEARVEAPAPIPRPGGTHRALSSRSAPPPTALVDEPAVEAPAVRIALILGPDDELNEPIWASGSFAPWQWFPRPDEAPLPDDDTARAVQELLDAEARDADPGTDALQAAAEAEGYGAVTADLDDPWRTLVALEVARRLDRDAHPDIRVAADALAAAYAGESVADFAALYGLFARSRDPHEGDAERVLALLEQTDDVLVAEAAASTLAQVVRRTDDVLEPEDLDRLRRRVPDFGPGGTKLSATVLALNHATRLGHDIAWWVDAARDGFEESCPGGYDPESTCATYAPMMQGIAGQFAGVAPPATWTESLAATVWACHRAGDSIEPFSRETLVATWDDGWAWELSEPRSPLAACVAREADTRAVPSPEPGTKVEIGVGRAP